MGARRQFVQVARCTGSGAQYISRPSPQVSSTPFRQAASDGYSGATPTKPHPRGSGRSCRRRSCSFGECSGSSWRRESVGETVVGSSESGKVKSERPCQCADRNLREVSGACKRLVVANEELEKVVEKKNNCTSDVEATELRLARLRASVPTPMNQEPAAVAELQGRIDELIRERDALRSAVPLLGDPAATLPASGAEEVNMHVAHFRGKSSTRASSIAGGIGLATCRGSFSVDVDLDRSRRFSCERTLQPSHVRVMSARYGLRAIRVGVPPRPSFGEVVPEINAILFESLAPRGASDLEPLWLRIQHYQPN